MKRYKVLLNIDCLFDTKLGTVTSLNPEWGVGLLEGGYLDRLSNKLSLYNPSIDDKAVAERWALRDMEVLRLSKSTNILNLLSNYAAISNKGDPEHPEALHMSVVLNTYPYELSRKEMVTMFTYLRDILGIERLTQVFLPVLELTPTYLKGNFNKFIIYNLEEWNDSHIMSLPDCPMPYVQCNAPLCFLESMAHEPYQSGTEAAIEQQYASHLRLELLPLSDFSICPPLAAE